MKNFLSFLIILLLIALFLYTGLSKLSEYQSFKLVLSKSPLFSKSTSSAIAVVLPIGEILLAGFLLVSALFVAKWLPTALATSGIILIGFTGYLIYMVSFAQHLPCSCGGVISKMTWKQHIFFNLFFISISWFAYSFYKRPRQLLRGVQLT